MKARFESKSESRPDPLFSWDLEADELDDGTILDMLFPFQDRGYHEVAWRSIS